MASDRAYLEFIKEQLSEAEDVSFRPMMGEYLIYCRGRVIGGIYDERLLVKKTPSACSLMPDAPSELPYEGGKEMLLVDNVDDRAFLCMLCEAIAADLPAPKKRK